MFRLKDDTLEFLEKLKGIVFCEECKFYVQANDKKFYCTQGAMLGGDNAAFCARGEKK